MTKVQCTLFNCTVYTVQLERIIYIYKNILIIIKLLLHCINYHYYYINFNTTVATGVGGLMVSASDSEYGGPGCNSRY